VDYQLSAKANGGIMSDRIVYSTDSGRVTTCPRCGQPYKKCRCDEGGAAEKKPVDSVVRLRRERKGRGGKTVSIISNVPESEQVSLAQQLKKLCGTGGTVKEGNIEIQGDHLEKIQEKLTALGYKVKRTGG